MTDRLFYGGMDFGSYCLKRVLCCFGVGTFAMNNRHAAVVILDSCIHGCRACGSLWQLGCCFGLLYVLVGKDKLFWLLFVFCSKTGGYKRELELLGQLGGGAGAPADLGHITAGELCEEVGN